MQIDHYLRALIETESSDLHFIAGQPPRMRTFGDLKSFEDDVLTAARTEEILREIMPQAAQNQLEDHDSADFAYMIEGVARFRVNILRHLGGLGGIFRAIPTTAKTLEDLSMPPAVRELCKETQGLLLVTGKTGSGKSTTLAAMIAEINANTKGHIITIEDPIEFVHERNRCLVSQREVGLHCANFSDALHSALREDPDVILVGEMRDLETIRLALSAAETGHLVFGTLHTSSAAKTIDRIVDVFPAAEKEMVRSMLSESLRAVISQTLMKKIGGGRVAAHEIMLGTPAIRNLIRENKIAQMYSAIQTGQSIGMQTLDQNLQELLNKGLISKDEAIKKAANKEAF